MEEGPRSAGSAARRVDTKERYHAIRLDRMATNSVVASWDSDCYFLDFYAY
jgi:hypothetical protein